MKKSITKISILVLAFLFTVVALLAGCGGNNQPAATTTAAAQESGQAVQTTAEPLKEVTLQLYFPDRKYAAFDEVWNKISETTKDSLNVKFDINFVGWDDYPNKIQLLTSSGDKFDGYFDANWFIYNQMVTKGALLDLTELLPKYAPEYTKQLEALNSIKPILVNGKLYAMPWTLPSPQRSYFIYRADLAEKYGVDLSNAKTLEDLEPYLEAIKKNEPGMMPTYWDKGVGANSLNHLFKSLMVKYDLDMVGDGFVYSLNDPACKITPHEQTDAFKEAVQITRKWYDAGYIAKNMISTSQEEDKFIVGKAASQWFISEGAYANIQFQNVPGAKNAGVALYPDHKAIMASPLNNVFCVNKNAANPERLLMFIEKISTDREIYDMVIYGIEGKTYVLNGDMADYPQGMDGGSSTYMDWSGQWPFWRQQFMRPNTEKPASFWQKMDEVGKEPNNVMGTLSSFTANTDAVKTELSKRDTIADEELRIMEFGIEKDADKALSDYIAHQQAAGVDVIVKEMQKQIDAFIADSK